MDWYWILVIVVSVLLAIFIVSALFYKQFFKRTYDIFLSLLAILLLSPIYLFLIIAGLIAMKGNPFFYQLRPGKDEKVFKLIKFRSMTNKKDSNGNLLPDEKRLTKYGKFIRRTSLDELPELFNIFIGDMSVVGPRPLCVSYLPWYNEREKHRHDVRPGLTGLAQANGRSALAWDKRFEYDVEYVEKVSIFLDIKIIVLTAVKLFRKSEYVEAGQQGNFDEIRKRELEKKQMKKMLMLGTSYASCEMIKYAKSIGVYTIVTDPNSPEKSIAKKIADEYWMINTGDVDTLEKKCREENISAVICGISEFNLEVAMELAKRLGLKCYCTPEAWHYSRDKDDFKALCREINAPIAKDYFVSKDLTDEELSIVEYPVVVKPVDLSGNRGVAYCYNKDDLIKAYEYALSVSKSEKIIVERMLHGEEWYSAYAVANGEISLLALNAMYAQPGEPKNCYTITTTVSNHVKQYLEEINPKIEELLRKIGCTDGFVWVQTMLDKDGKFYIIEMGYRMDGEMMFMPYKDLIGFDTIKWLVETSLGIEHKKDDLPIPQAKAFEGCACGMELWTNKDGVITRMEGFEEIASLNGVFVETLKQIGDPIIKYRPVGVITFATENCEKMIDLIDRVNKLVHVYNENGEDVIIKYNDFDYLRKVYKEGLEGK